MDFEPNNDINLHTNIQIKMPKTLRFVNVNKNIPVYIKINITKPSKIQLS